MRTVIVVNVDDKSIRRNEYSNKQVLDSVLSAIGSKLYSMRLSFDCGYNPELVTSSDIN